MAKESNKTKQIGVRFDKDLLEGVIKGGLARSPQTALNLYEKSYVELIELKVEENNTPKNKANIKKERSGENTVTKNAQLPLTEEECQDEPQKESKIAQQLREAREKFLTKK